MKALGFFAEVEPSTDALPRLSDLAGKLDPAVKPLLLQYLAHGTPIFDAMEATPNPLDAGNFVPGGSSLITDGEWVWRLDLSNYISAHALGLPADFIAIACAASRSQTFPSVVVTPELVQRAMAAAGWG